MAEKQPIVTLSDSALKHIKKIIENNCATGLRLAVKKTGCSGYAYLTDIIDQPNPGDLEYKIDGISLFVDQASMKLLNGTQIDFINHGLGQTKLIFNNPNAAHLCGCGESFNLAEE